MSTISFRFNGQDRTVTPEPHTVVELVRDQLGERGTKLVCGTGSCGACVIHVDDVPVASCLLPVEELDGRDVRTIESLGSSDVGELHPVQKAFVANDAMQCGFCTPGFVMEAVAFHDDWRRIHGTTRPSQTDIEKAMAGHLCRCGAYAGIRTAIAEACEGRFDGVAIPTPSRVDAVAKVTGSATYTVDVSLDGMVHGVIIRSPVAHADVVDVDPWPALEVDGVLGFVSLLKQDRRLRYVGQEIGAIAAVDEETARHAATLVALHLEELPAVVGIDAALADDAPDLHVRGWTPPSSSEAPPLPNLRRGNLRGPVSIASKRRFTARHRLASLRGSDGVSVEGTFEVGAQAHTAFEPHACVADWRQDGLTVYLSTQSVSPMRRRIAEAFEIDEEAVTVVADHVGGAFGAKQGMTEEAFAAIGLSRAVGAPVRVVNDRREELSVGGYRPGARLSLGLGLSPDGDLSALSLESHADGGASAGQIIALFGRISYPGAPRSLLDYDVLTNAPPGKPFRAPGGPVAAWALEQGVDDLAIASGVDPVTLRRRWDPPELRARLYDWVDAHEVWRGRTPIGRQNGRFRRGVGVAFGSWTYFFDPATQVEVATDEGTLVVRTGTQDMGNGTRTALASAVASAFGIESTEVRVEIGRSGEIHGPVSSGSRTTPSVWPTAHAAARDLRGRILEHVDAELGWSGARAVPGGVDHAGETIPWSQVLDRVPPIRVRGERPKDGKRPITPFTIEGLQVGNGLTHAAHVVELEVDTRLGRITPLRVWAAMAVGTVHVPALARSQAQAGVIQGIGHTLYEERILDPNIGVNLSANLDDYRISGIGDAPEIVVDFLEGGFEHAPGGGAGLAELVVIGVPAAVGNAVMNATGWRPRELPIRPDRLVEALR